MVLAAFESLDGASYLVQQTDDMNSGQMQMFPQNHV